MLLLFALVCSTFAVLQRREFLLDFDFSPSNKAYVASSERFMSEWPCFATSSVADSATASWVGNVTAVNDDSFLENATLSFSSTDALFLSSPLPCLSQTDRTAAEKTLYFSACPYQVVGGTGLFAGASGAFAGARFDFEITFKAK